MPLASSCLDAAMLSRLQSGQLSVVEVEELAQHLEGCSRCTAAVGALRSDDTLADALRARSTTVDRPERDVVANLVSHIKQLGSMVVASPEATAAFVSAAPSSVPTVEGTQEVYDFLAPPRGPGEIGWLGPYRVLKVLGVGGMGVVFEAEDTLLHRRVALKTMKPSLSADVVARERFLREARAAAAVHSDHVVTLHQVGEIQGVLFLAMEFLEGESLDAWIKRGRQPSVAQLLRIGRDMALGLSAVHERGLIHRDIKPSNIWLEMPTGRVKLLDFGLVRAADAEVHVTQSGAILGSPAYMAPEQARGEKVDVRCDLFSLGCVLYRLATGAMPFKGGDTMSVLMSLAVDMPPAPLTLNSQLPPALAQMIEQLLCKDPAGRPESARAVAQALQDIERETTMTLNSPQSLAVQPSHTPSADVQRTLPSVAVASSVPLPRGRRRADIAVAAGLLLLLGAAVAGTIVIRIKTPDGKTTEIKVPDGSTVEVQRQADRGKPAADASKPLLDQEKPFVLLRDGKLVREFRSFPGLLPELHNGDVIEVHANGPVLLPRIALDGTSLTLRAAPGYRPRFEAKEDVVGNAPWIKVSNASLTLDGCDFRCPPVGSCSLHIEKGTAEVRNCRLFQPPSHNSGLLVYDGPRLLVADSLLASGFSHWAIDFPAKAEVEFRNNVFWNISYTYFILEAPGGQKLRLINNTFAGGGILLGMSSEKYTTPPDVLARGNLFGLGGGPMLGAPLPPKELTQNLHWHGRDNFYNLGAEHSVYNGPDAQQSLVGFAAWQKLWGENEQGGRNAAGSQFQISALMEAPTVAEQEAVLRPILEAHRRRLPNAGPNLSLLGPGDAYVRALAAAGKPVPKDELQPEAEDGGSIVLLRKGKALRGYPFLHQALEAVADGDIIELRTDKEVAGATRDGLPGKRLVLRAGAGYRPVITGGLYPGKGDNWVIEGIHFRGPLNYRDSALGGRIARLANCSFEPHPARASAALVQLNDSDDTAPLEVVNCSIPGQVWVGRVAKGRRLRVVNSLIAAVRYGFAEKGNYHLELEQCLCWDPTDQFSAVTNELEEVKVTVQARDCVFETIHVMRGTSEATAGSGDGNVYAVGNAGWRWGATEMIFDLAGWRKLWKSDAHSIEVEPLRYDPRQWRLLPSSPARGSAPGGKDYGADVNKIAVRP
jgi:serine/threonine protein kinase